MPKPKIYSKDDLYITDNTNETEFLRNNCPNYDGIQEIMHGPLKTIENNMLADIFTDQFEGTPDDSTVLDAKLMHQLIGAVMMDIEALIKCYARHGENTIVEGDTKVEKVDKRTGKVHKTLRITALENLIQAAAIGMWVETTTAIRHAGEKHKLHVINKLMNKNLKTKEELDDFIKKAKQAEDGFVQFKEKMDGKEWLMDVFPNPAQLAKAVIAHQEGEKDFLCSVKESKFMQDMEKIDRDIMLNKISDELSDLLDNIKNLPF
tara:strand:+ start:1493 stop:2281 length:789 start_codon:yes stop_codon:yes gene_type:complete